MRSADSKYLTFKLFHNIFVEMFMVNKVTENQCIDYKFEEYILKEKLCYVKL